MGAALFRFDDYVPPGEAFHVVSKRLDADVPARLHEHDYFELFLVEDGALVQETREGRARLEAGDLAMLRPDDAHALHAGAGAGCRIVNVMFHRRTAAHLAERYAEDLAGRFFWHGEPGVWVRRLAGPARDTIARQTERLRRGPRSLSRIERYLLELMTDLLSGAAEPAGLPAWLAEACRAARAPEVFRMGGAGMVAAAGRAHEHVCRQAKRHLGMTPTQYVNRIRMEHAAMLLGSSDRTLGQIAEACGFEGQGHFHRLFRAQFGATPASFRRGAGDPVQGGAPEGG